jgi:hypothetical protein
MPGYGGFRVLTSAILTHGFSQAGPLLIALAWLAGATAAAGLLFRHNMRTASATGRPRPLAAGDLRSGQRRRRGSCPPS